MKTLNKLIHNEKDYNNFIDNLKTNNENFNILFSTSKIIINHYDVKYTYYPNNLGSKKGLYFIKKVKNYIIDNNISYNFNHKIKYSIENSLIKNSINYKRHLYEVDLKGAYWYMAYKNNFISEDIFKEGLTVDKKIRLMALGALAKNQTQFNYVNGDLIGLNKITSELTQGIFFKVAFDVDTIMRELIRQIDKKDFIFYWVDAVFFRGKNNLSIIENKLKEMELLYKVVEIKRIIKKQFKYEVEDFDFKKRDFNFKKTNTKKFI